MIPFESGSRPAQPGRCISAGPHRPFQLALPPPSQGTFILRIEDTDQARSTDESIRVIIDGMKWLGMDWTGPSYCRTERSKGTGLTERMEIYREYADRLLRENKAYYCYCSPEELDMRRKKAMADGRRPSMTASVTA